MRDPETNQDVELDAIVDRAVLGNRDAFSDLYARHAPAVYRYLYRRTLNHALSEDIAAQTFLNAWLFIRGFRWQGRPFVAWLYQLARNAHIDYARKWRHEQEPIDEYIERGLTTTDREYQRVVDADVLARVLPRLSRLQRDVLVCKFLIGLGTEETCVRLGLSGGAVRALQMRGLQSARRILDRAERRDDARRRSA